MNNSDESSKIGLLAIILFFSLISFWPRFLVEGSPFMTIQQSINEPIQQDLETNNLAKEEIDPYYISNNTFFTPINTPVLIQVKKVYATAYSSTPDQTDGDPFTTASGAHVYDGVLAANFLSFNTKVRIPEVFGDKIFIVEDRMNSRFGDNRIDIWFPDRTSAQEFGIQETTIEILNY